MSEFPRQVPARVAAVMALAAASLLPAPVARAADAADITSRVLAGADVTLDGPSVVNLPAGTTTYNGVLSGTGTLTIAGSGTLVLTQNSDFTLPAAERHQTVTTTKSSHPYTTVSNPDPPAITVARGATLQYGSGGSAGIIGHYPYGTPGYALNEDNIEVDGTLALDIQGGYYNLGTISGSGLVFQPRNTWGTLDFAGTQPFAGVVYNGTGMSFGKPYYPLSLPDAKAVDNLGSLIFGTPYNQTVTIRQNFYENHWGNDINFHTAAGGLVVVTGVYSYADGGMPGAPTLSDAALDTGGALPGGANVRGVNIEGAHVQWGDGTTHQIFLPASATDAYINIHHHGTLAFDYDGPVTLGTPISGGVYHASLSTPAYADVTLNATRGNAVTFAAPENYHGTTTIGAGATLLLGGGGSGGDGSLLTGGPYDAIADDGALVVRNAATPVTLSNLSGGGSLTQSGAATTTLTGSTPYTGQTTVASGTLALGAGARGIADSSGLILDGGRFDLSAAGDQTIRDLSGSDGTLALGSSTLTVRTADTTIYRGSVTGSGGLVKTGTGSLTLTGGVTTGGTWRVDQGTLALGGSAVTTGGLDEAAGATLRVTPHAGTPALTVTGPTHLAGTLAVAPTGPMTAGEHLTLIHETGPTSAGAFTGLAEGAEFTADGTVFQITYKGGSGHDVVLTAVASASATATPPTTAPRPSAAAAPTSPHRTLLPELALAALLVAAAALGAAALLLRRHTRPTNDP